MQFFSSLFGDTKSTEFVLTTACTSREISVYSFNSDGIIHNFTIRRPDNTQALSILRFQLKPSVLNGMIELADGINCIITDITNNSYAYDQPNSASQIDNISLPVAITFGFGIDLYSLQTPYERGFYSYYINQIFMSCMEKNNRIIEANQDLQTYYEQCMQYSTTPSAFLVTAILALPQMNSVGER